MNPWMNQPACDPFPTEGAATMSDPRWNPRHPFANNPPVTTEQAIFKILDWHLDDISGCSTAVPEIIKRVVAPLLAEAERRGAERGWDAALVADGDRWQDGDLSQPLVNPYRAGDDQ